LCFFQEKLLTVFKCHNFLGVQQWHNCPPAASFVNCIMTLYPLKVFLQMFLSIPITQKCQILSCDTLVANEWYFVSLSNWSHLTHLLPYTLHSLSSTDVQPQVWWHALYITVNSNCFTFLMCTQSEYE
jgi:hypothetical protein